jgi:hypothetical protein
LQGDHLDFAAIERALLRRQARQVQRVEDSSSPWRGQEPLWIVAPHLPTALSEGRDVRALAPGCYEIGPAWFAFRWIAANELPLVDELVPFLVARTGRALDDFARWVAPRRPAEWLLRMVQIVPMSIPFAEALLNSWIQTDEPEILDRQRQLLRAIVTRVPGLRDELVGEARDEGLALLVHQFERRLGRRLSDDEHRVLRERLRALGPDRLGDVVLDLTPEALAVWLADPAST